MKIVGKEKMETIRQTSALKTMYYTRYFMIRYVVTFFFFTNLYWIIMLYLSKASATVFIPIVLGTFAFFAMWEQFKMYSTKQKKATVTKTFFKTTIAVNACLIVMTLAGQSYILYPFFNTSFTSRMVVTSLLALGILLSFWMLVKISHINTNKDRQYARINRYLASLKPSKHY
ncbi:hypothetical protein [Streptococcus porcinus]|uniref:Membrane protein n=2 Tax=Streptococcus porcinus TaxID=1340 RepID=A0A4V0H9X4_STRPO|nr:hypothetical protein [Streptococcus porcinus]EGJ27776.1 hypothetical protein STRPO_0773 [Streptococcus porcinus str. Jelinkova 176]SQG44777.1 membrane protein [Streptococcus porcinus]VTT45056.1 membrane protein [Streptococcus porcinus]VTT46568.1 membrane protein [Streptococcus porcinus]